jgi:hypothetical protein
VMMAAFCCRCTDRIRPPRQTCWSECPELRLV